MMMMMTMAGMMRLWVSGDKRIKMAQITEGKGEGDVSDSDEDDDDKGSLRLRYHARCKHVLYADGEVRSYYYYYYYYY